MAKNTAPFSTASYTIGQYDFLNATGTTSEVVATAGANDSNVKAVLATSTDTSVQVLELIVNDGTTDHVISAFSIPAGSGTNGTAAAVDLLNITGLPKDAAGKLIFGLPASLTLKCRAQGTITSGKKISVSAFLENY